MNGTNSSPDISDVGNCHESEDDRQEIDESICGPKDSQLLLEKKARREDLKSGIERGVIVLNAAPINRFSDDVLCHLFELHCKDSLPVTLPPMKYFAKPAPPQITLSHVCSAWRKIMLDVPKFWSSIKIVPSWGSEDKPQIFVSAVKAANTCLSRAKGLPCSIEVDFPEGMTWTSLRSLWKQDWHENIIRDLISLHKFKKLGVTFADRHLRDLLRLPDDKLSCVEDLCLRYVNEDDTTLPLDLHKLSNLTSFSLSPNTFASHSPSDTYSNFASIPWHNLRHIQLRVTLPATFCLDVLEQCSAVLETCSLVITGDLSFTSSPREPVHLFQLRELDVVVHTQFKDEATLELFLLSLRFPNLKSLTLGSYKHPGPISLEMLIRAQNTSQMQLEGLIIFQSTLKIDVRALLMGFPSLRRLELPNKVTFTDEAMFEVGEGSIGVFLEDLTINDSFLDLKTLLLMVRARSRGCGNKFTSILFHCHQDWEEVEDPDVGDLFEELEKLGADLAPSTTSHVAHQCINANSRASVFLHIVNERGAGIGEDDVATVNVSKK